MPCMGPGINSSDLEKAYAEIMKVLAEKYGIQSGPPAFYLNKDWTERVRQLANDNFKEALKKLFIGQACEDF